MLRKSWRGGVLVAAVGFLAMTSVGCSWRVGRMFGETWFIMGAYNVNDPHPRTEVEAASDRALHNMGYAIPTIERSADKVMLEAESKTGPDVVRVHLSDGPANSTRISYHINSFGNRKLAKEILAKTREELAGPGAVPPPKK